MGQPPAAQGRGGKRRALPAAIKTACTALFTPSALPSGSSAFRGRSGRQQYAGSQVRRTRPCHPRRRTTVCLALPPIDTSDCAPDPLQEPTGQRLRAQPAHPCHSAAGGLSGLYLGSRHCGQYVGRACGRAAVGRPPPLPPPPPTLAPSPCLPAAAAVRAARHAGGAGGAGVLQRL